MKIVLNLVAFLFVSFSSLATTEPPLPKLHQAVIAGDLAIVKLLVQSGADVNQLDPHMGNSPLHIAAQTDHTDILEYLIEQGAFINLQTPRSGFTPLMTAAWYSKPENIKALFKHSDLNIELTNRTGAKAESFIGGWDRDVDANEAKLQAHLRSLFAAKKAQQEALLAQQKILNLLDLNELSDKEKAQRVALLIAQGQDVNQKRPVYSNRNDLHTPLLVASREGLVEVVKVLLANGADQTIAGFPMDAIPFHKAGYMGHPEIVELLVNAEKVDQVINAQGPNNGYTPLHDAIWHGHTDAAKVFIDAGANLDLINYESDTPLALAERYGYREIAELIKAAQQK